jgi:hypothetical protein
LQSGTLEAGVFRARADGILAHDPRLVEVDQRKIGAGARLKRAAGQAEQSGRRG